MSIRVDDIPAQPPHTAEGKALPPEIVAQVVTSLPDLERRCGPTARTAIELLIHTGRRPDEICQLPLDCLDVGGDGKAVLRYTDYKQNRPNRSLPIGDATADLIRGQQQRVQSTFPQTPNEQLMLIPARTCNPHGTKPTRATTLSNLHRDWIQRHRRPRPAQISRRPSDRRLVVSVETHQ